MQSSWQAFLASAQPESHDAVDPRAQAQAADAGAVLAPLADLAVIQASGADVLPFLQGQLSNDLRALQDGHSQLGAYCTPKGRMLALFRLVRRADAYLLLLPAEIAEAVLKRLRMFVMRSKVLVEDVSDRWLVLGASGAGAAATFGVDLPQAPDSGVWEGELGLVRLPDRRERYLALASHERLGALWPALSRAAPLVGIEGWRLLDVRAGLPQVYKETQESFVPQMANLDLINGISFTKGCYPGQEIVARMHYLGNLKRRMYRFQLNGEGTPEPGNEVRDEAGTLVGEVVTAATDPNGGIEGLAVLQIERAQQEGLRIGDATIRVTPPPYPLDNAQAR
jgi:folate-binding protein YgfZ